MEDDCEDVYSIGFLQRYVNRIVSLEYLILVDWVVWYDLCGKLYVRKFFINDLDNFFFEIVNDDENDDEFCNENIIIDKKNKKRLKS